MRFEEAQQLKPGTLLAVRQEVLDVDPEDSSDNQSLLTVVEDNGYLYRFTKLLDDKYFPIQCTSLASGKPMEFYLAEVEIAKEEDDDIL